jgi:V/A-type H+/Na+-transporting ATPase subunit F
VEYFSIGDEDTVLGFQLVGVAGQIATTGEEARVAFEHALKRPSIGIIIITERVAQSIRSVVDAYTFTEDFPLIVEIPDRTGSLPGRPTLRELVNDAIGVSV